MRKERKITYVLVLLFIALLTILAGCGGKSQEKVSKKIEKQLEKVTSYKATAEMTMKTGREERTYDIDVSFQNGEDNFYRVDLANEADDHKQTILKNEDGVFVLTPVMNKSFKFQSDWPEKNGQPYLYESLIQDIVEDREAAFTTSEDYYMFKTKTNYMNNKQLPYQHVYFDKKTYLPMFVQVLGEDEEPLIEVKFHDINLNPTFTEAEFNREAILGEANPDVKDEADESDDADESEEKEPSEGADEVAVTDSQAETNELLLPVVTKGAELVETEALDVAEGSRTIMTFKGERNFTLIQERMDATPVSTAAVSESPGELVHLGHSMGAVSDGMVEWNYKGTQFYLASDELTVDELIDVASSVYGREVK